MTGRRYGSHPIGVRDHSFQSSKSYLDGNATYPTAGSGGTSIRIARVPPLLAG